MSTFQVSITDKCDANCPYCVSKMTYQLDHKNFDWDNLQNAIHFARSKGIRVAKITGKWGEPLMVPELITGLLPRLRSFDIELQTNAQKIYAQRSIWIDWQNLGLSLVSISCVHWDRIRSTTLYPNPPYLPAAIEFLKSLEYTVRLNCLLIKGYIDSPWEVRDFINKFPNVEQISFIPIDKSERYTGMIGTNAYNWALNHRLSTKEKQTILDYLGHSYKVVSKNDYSTTFERGIYFADCLKTPKDEDKYRHIIYFPDGTLRSSWEEPDSIISIPQKTSFS